MSYPPPPITLPNQPFIMPLRIPRSRTVSSSPSSMPVNSACSDFLSTTLTRSMMLAGRFLLAIEGSSRKNCLPSIWILLIVLPLAVMEPSELTSTPGSFLSRSSSTSLSPDLIRVTLCVTVSFLTMIGLPTSVTVAPLRKFAWTAIVLVPRSVSLRMSTTSS